MRIPVDGDSAWGRVLVVDDQEANLTLLQRLLERAGYHEVHTTDDPAGLPSVLDEVSPDVVLLDWHMPEATGAEVLERLRADRRWSPLPVIVLTADEGARVEALELGATDFLTKPFDVTEVLLRLRNVLRTRRLHLELEATNEVLDDRVAERTAALEVANDRLLQAEVVRRDFVAMASHEMRTPITVIRGFVELWSQRGVPDSDSAEAQLDAMIRNVRRMEHLIQNLLLASRIETGREGHRGRRFRFAQIVRSKILDSFSDHPVEIVCDVDGEFEGDADLLQLVVANLVSNASRYGEPPIEVRATSVPGGAEVSVTDHGEGVPEEFLSQLFDRFSQATVGDRRTAQGAGLGLWVSHRIIEMHGGRLWYEAVPTGGAKFLFRLPLPEFR